MARSRAKPSEDGLAAQVTRAVPNIVVEVLPNNTAVHGGEHHGPGETFEVEGPTAIALVQAGHVAIVGSVRP